MKDPSGDALRILAYRRELASWGTRAFVVMAALAVTIIVGFSVVPSLAKVATVVGYILLVATAICLAIMVVRGGQWLYARHRFARGLAMTYGEERAVEFKQAGNPPWWNRMSRTSKTAYVGGALAAGVLLSLIRPVPGQPGFGLRAAIFVIVMIAGFLIIRFARR